LKFLKTNNLLKNLFPVQRGETKEKIVSAVAAFDSLTFFTKRPLSASVLGLSLPSSSLFFFSKLLKEILETFNA
jgi:hypothetical protein